MSFVLYQLGNVALPLWASSFGPLTLDIPRTFRGEVARLSESPVTTLETPIPILEPTTMSVSGTVFAHGGESVYDQVNRLTALAGVPHLDVIGYLPNECCTLGSVCSKCGGRSNSCVQWLHTTGFISEVVPVQEFDGSFSPDELMIVEMTITLRDLFYPINPWLWEPYYDGAAVSGLRQLDDLYKSNIPCRPPTRRLGQPDSFLWNKKNYRFPFELYHSDVWSNMPEEISRSRGWGIWSEYLVGGNSRRWSAPPSANYMFTNLPHTGTISIRVESEMGGSGRREHTSALSLALLNDQMAALGYEELLPTDIVVATDSVYAPSIVIRDDTLLDTMPIWNYRYQHVGQMLGPYNRVTIETPYDVASAHLHMYRMY